MLADLENKVWFRALKVIYYIALVLTLIVGMYAVFEMTNNGYSNEEFLLVSGKPCPTTPHIFEDGSFSNRSCDYSSGQMLKYFLVTAGSIGVLFWLAARLFFYIALGSR